MEKFTVFFVFCLILILTSILSGNQLKEIELKSYKTVSVGDADIAYKIIDESASDKAILTIMGYGCTMDMWPTKMIDKLKSKAKLILFDNRGMGYSSAGTKEFSIELFAEDANALLDSLELEKVSILGWSLGTAIGLQSALNNLDRIESVSLISGFCGGEETVWPPDSVWSSVLDLSGTIDERVQRMLNNLFPKKFLQANPKPSLIFPEITEPVNDINIAEQGKSIKKWSGCFDKLNEIKVPVYICTGDEDLVIPPENSDIIASQIGGCVIEKFDGGGHGVLYQFPDEISEGIIEVLE